MRRIPYDPDRPRVIILGFDGLSPRLAEQWMEAGLLPNFNRLAREGTFRPLKTTIPPESPIAWSSFATSCNPGKHSVFGFLQREPENYLPQPLQVSLGRKIGPWQVPMPRHPRRGKSFWQVAAENGVSTTVMRAPLAFPAERLRGGLLLSGLGTPGLSGQSGSFTVFRTDQAGEDKSPVVGGKWVRIRVENSRVETELEVLHMPARGLTRTVPLRFQVDRAENRVKIELQGSAQTVGVGGWSDWFRISVPIAPIIRISALCRFYVVSVNPELWIHTSQVVFDPASIVPVSSPIGFARTLARELGPFNTGGIPDEFGGLVDGDLPEDAFLADMYAGWRRQEAIDEYVHERYPSNLYVALHLQTDVLQHTFWRFTDPESPVYEPELAEKYGNAILQGYQHADGLLGRIVEKYVDDQTTVMVLSDHGFGPFRRTININTWLVQNGFLSAKLLVRKDVGSATITPLFFRHVRWSHTQAYVLGLEGIYLNLQGREGQGIVAPGEEARRVKAAIRDGLKALVDPKTGVCPVRELYDAEDIYHGPYAEKSPDLLAALALGYRMSWQSMLGGVEAEVFSDNATKWSGDHVNLPPELSDGIFFSNRKLATTSPRILDLGPTALALLGVPIPADMDGEVLL